MRNARFEDGAHVVLSSNDDGFSTEKARKLSQKANMALVQMGRQVEHKKAERMQARMHMIDMPKQNTHLKFVTTPRHITNNTTAEAVEPDSSAVTT